MKWDIFGRKKLLERISFLESEFDSVKQFLLVHSNKLNEIADNNQNISDKFDRLIDELKKIQEVTQVPVLRPRLRNPEDVYHEEQKQEKEKYSINMFKN